MKTNRAYAVDIYFHIHVIKAMKCIYLRYCRCHCHAYGIWFLQKLRAGKPQSQFRQGMSNFHLFFWILLSKYGAFLWPTGTLTRHLNTSQALNVFMAFGTETERFLKGTLHHNNLLIKANVRRRSRTPQGLEAASHLLGIIDNPVQSGLGQL